MVILIIDGVTVRVTAERDPKNLKWDEVDVDVVADCTGIFTDLDNAQAHIDAGAKKVVISAPSKTAPMFVMGVNDHELTADHTYCFQCFLYYQLSCTYGKDS